MQHAQACRLGTLLNKKCIIYGILIQEKNEKPKHPKHALLITIQRKPNPQTTNQTPIGTKYVTVLNESFNEGIPIPPLWHGLSWNLIKCVCG